MSELVKEFWMVYHYDRCLHGCNDRWWNSSNECKCPIGKPYAEKHSIIKRSLFEAYGIPYNPDGMPREKVLEILNEWTGNAARAGIYGERYGRSDETGKITQVIEQYPARWIYFLDPPQWLLDANELYHKKFEIKWDANKTRMEQDFEKFGLSIKWIYHDKLESFIVPLDVCFKGIHYADEVPKDSPVETEFNGWGSQTWVCPDCKNEFVLVDNWQSWKRKSSEAA